MLESNFQCPLQGIYLLDARPMIRSLNLKKAAAKRTGK